MIDLKEEGGGGYFMRNLVCMYIFLVRCSLNQKKSKINKSKENCEGRIE